MANDDENPSGTPGARRKRRPTVIDLPATELPSETAAPEPQAEAASPSDPVPKPEDAFIPPPPVTPAAAASEQASTESIKESPKTETEPPGRRPAFTMLPEQPSRGHISAGLAGVAGGLLVAVLAWLFGAVAGGRDTSADLNPKLAAIEQQSKDIATRPVPASVDPKAFDAVAGRLTRLEAAQAAPRAPVTDPVVLGRLTAAESAAKSQADNAAAMSRRAEALDTALRETNARLDKLTAVLGEVQTTARAAAAGSDRASRLAVAASALRNAVEHGDPFAAELAIVKPLAPDASAVAILEPFAASGVPSDATLGKELVAIVHPLVRASEPVREAGFLDRLQANAKQLVRVSPIGEEARGDDRGAILSRIEQRAAQGNIFGALSEIAKLPPDVRAPMQAWAAKAEARNKALDASRRLAADAVAALKAAP